MKSRFIHSYYQDLSAQKRNFQNTKKYWEILKDHPTLKWIEERLEDEIVFDYLSYPTIIFRDADIQKVCGFAGELGFEFNCDVSTLEEGDAKRISFTIHANIHKEFSEPLRLLCYPKNSCIWIEGEKTVHHSSWENTKRHLICN